MSEENATATNDENVVQFSSETIETLKKLYNVNATLKLVDESGEDNQKYLRSVSSDKSLLVIAPIKETIPREFNIYDLKEFLAVQSIIEEPIIDFSNEAFLEIKSEDGYQKLRYMESQPKMVNSYTEKTPNLDNLIDVSFVVPAEDFKRVYKAASTMSLDNIGFICDGEKINLCAFSMANEDTVETNYFAIEVGEFDTPFKMFFKMEHSKQIGVFLDEGDLRFNISSKRICRVESGSGKTFYSSFNSKSTFGDGS